MLTLVALTWVLLAASARAQGPQAAEPCPNEQSRIAEPFGLALPDCRAYEQVSPVEKNIADALGSIAVVRGAADGQALTYASLGPFPLNGGSSEGSSQLFDLYASVRSGDGWSTQSIEAPVAAGGSAEPMGVTEDLRYTFERSNNQPPLTAEGIEGREALYMRENATGKERLLFQLPAGETASFFFVASAAQDTRVFFESTNPLSAAAAPGTRNLYEWHEGQLSLVDLLPGGSPPSGGAGAGQRGPGAAEEGSPYFAQNAVSSDGSQIYFTDLGTGLLYLRHQMPGGEGQTVGVSGTPAAWQAATPDGSVAFYVAEGVLYRYADQATSALTTPGGEVLGVLGVSSDGSRVYFAADGALAPGAVAGDQNIYLSQEGAISLVTTAGEEDDWTAHTLPAGGPDEGVRSARVSADGDTLLFTSRGRVSGYDNHGAGSECGEGGTEACSEIYLYDATAHSLSCVSCNPAGAPATRDALLYHLENDGFIAPEPMYPANLPRNLSADGARVVFETEEALLPSDTNGQMDVYEWERAGSGSCLPTANSQGCLYLLSTGVSEESSYFAEASASADDVFLFTRQPLVAQDEDELVDVYDARVGGGIAAQNTVASAGECSGESCHPPQPPPTEPQPTISQTFTGSENLAPQPASAPVPVTHPSKKAHKRHKRKHAKQKRGHRGSSNRRAPRDRKTSAGRTR